MRTSGLFPALAAFLFLALAPSSATELEVGKPFPDLVLPSLEDGSPTTLAHFRGQKVILHVFASW